MILTIIGFLNVVWSMGVIFSPLDDKWFRAIYHVILGFGMIYLGELIK